MSMLIDELAKAIHDGWWEYQKSKGRVYGPDPTDKTHPHMLPWHKCGLANNNQDRYQACRVLHFLGKSPGLELKTDETTHAVARLLHQASVEVMKLQGRGDHEHCGPWEQKHKDDPAEHEFQAARVRDLLTNRGFKTGILA